MNTYEKIKSMDVEEMADMLNTHGFCQSNETIHYEGCEISCYDCIKKWLESEANKNTKV